MQTLEATIKAAGTKGVDVTFAPNGQPVMHYGHGIFNLIGTGYEVVTVDGRAADCANPLGI